VQSVDASDPDAGVPETIADVDDEHDEVDVVAFASFE
jgi:hypothetical protein